MVHLIAGLAFSQEVKGCYYLTLIDLAVEYDEVFE